MNNSFNLSLPQFIKKRNGVPMGAQNSLRNMLYRSLGARNFATFWNYWNPIFGYYLGKMVFKPLRKILPMPLALVFTFIVCGLIHDFVTIIARGSTSLFFSQWFLLMGLWVVISGIFKLDFALRSWPIRAIMNLIPILTSFFFVYYFNSIQVF